jgi:two-component system, OmpR family, sensor kinase
MDGFKGCLKNSLQIKLIGWLSVAITIVAITTGVVSYVDSFHEANEVQDGLLIQVAALANHQSILVSDLNNATIEANGLEPDNRIILQSLTQPTANVSTLPLALTLPDGLQTIHFEQSSYRVFIKTRPDGERIAISQDTEIRDEIARDSAIRSVLPLLILIPILIGVIVKIVRQMLKPIAELAMEIDARRYQELHPLSTPRLSAEIRPFVTAINRLLGRVNQASITQRRFLADAAHELRSPLTALSLQAERLDAAEMSFQAKERLKTLRQGIARGRYLLEQLLSLARAQGTTPEPTNKVSVQMIYCRVLEDLMPLAEAKGIDIGVVNSFDTKLLIHELDLVMIIKNLIDNAIRYTPHGGRVDLFLTETVQQVVITVEDNGVGIPVFERERVFAPFYRLLGADQTGSGLGLSIVKTVVERLKGRIELAHSNQFSQGLKVSVLLDKQTYM